MPPNLRSFTKSQARPYTPPPELSNPQSYEADTPRHTAVITCKLVASELGIHIPKATIEKVSYIPSRTQTRILSSHQVRRQHHRPDSGPHTSSGQPQITNQEWSAVTDYLTNNQVSANNRSKH